MNKKIFTLSDGANMNYVASICRIDELFPIENSDNLLRTVVNGYDIVVDKKTNVGDIVIYFPVESAISLDFLGKNNLLDISNYYLNDNKEIVEKLFKEQQKAAEDGNMQLSDEKKAEIKKLCGFFGNKGRVKTITLRGCPSQGFIIPVTSLCKWKTDLSFIKDWEVYVGTVFDTVNGELLVKKYIRPIKEIPQSSSRGNKRQKNLKKFDRLFEDQFKFHYDTMMLNTNMWKFNPEDVVTITKKIHGTSLVCANVLCNKKLSFFDKIKKFFGISVKTLEYGNVYSSRSVVKNRYINPGAKSFYNIDVWGWANDIISPYLDEGMTVYAEVYGYLPDSNKFVQQWHDYGCDPSPVHPRHTLIMPYRITMTDKNGDTNEWSVQEVYDWVINLLSNHPEMKDKIEPLTIWYHGKFMDLYPDIDTENHWHENVLARMKTDTEHFHMEEDDPTCTKFLIGGKGKKAKFFQAPIEGIVIRKDSDSDNNVSQAFKLKTQKHYAMESVLHDQDATDIEESESQNE